GRFIIKRQARHLLLLERVGFPNDLTVLILVERFRRLPLVRCEQVGEVLACSRRISGEGSSFRWHQLTLPSCFALVMISSMSPYFSGHATSCSSYFFRHDPGLPVSCHRGLSSPLTS